MATRAHTVPRFYLSGFVAPESAAHRDPFVWVGKLATGEIARRSPRNLSTVRGLYDGPGGFDAPNASIERHLAKIESAASVAIQRYASTSIAARPDIPPEVSRFLAWQAARTPGWMAEVQQWAEGHDFGDAWDVVEPPPPGIKSIRDRSRPHVMEDPATGERREVAGQAELKAYRERGWRWVLSRDDHLEMLHMQAWYFQVRHFPRLLWTRLDTPSGDRFITSDRAVTWQADGYIGTPPSALRHPKAQLFAPLTRKVALIGRHEVSRLSVSAREVNRAVAATASEWIAGPTREAVAVALKDRAAGQPH